MATFVSRLYKNAMKAETEIIKNYMEGDKPFNWYYGTYKEGNMEYKCVTEGHVLVAFGFDSFAIDKSVFGIHNKVLSDNAISQMANRVDKSSFQTGKIIGSKVLHNDKKKYTYDVIQLDTGAEIMFNHKFMKYFVDDGSLVFKAFNDITPIKVYSGDIFLGFIMPIRDNTK